MRTLACTTLASTILAPLALLSPGGAAVSAPLDPRAQQELSADLSLGKVVDREGVASVRAATEERWRCAEEHRLLLAGDTLKTGARGANALQVKLRNGATLTLGPDSLIELKDAATLHVSRGEVEVGASEKTPLQVEGPAGAALEAKSTLVVRARDRELAVLAEKPRWLEGYQAGRPTEALGSLLANVDGRDVPLTLGYHKVTVDVRDQIARTVIEESFENHTDHVLEGVFYFPLPADASISSFGMWIGDELVEGDIVEKERARAIYEQILREKRDPGLLEWSGGSVFKARIYPIVGEKRVKLAYTQVLPKEGDTYAWHYSLQSELLKLHPLRQLAIEVHVSSAEPLAAVASPTHDCRVQATEHGARVSFDAQEYVPDRDFELRVRTKPAGAEGASPGGLTFVEDYRGDEGYFLVRFSAPAASGAAGPGREPGDAPARATAPVDWLILADTSGSMRGPAREAQLAFVEALLQSLAEKDTVQLATCDVETRFCFPKPAAAGDDARAAAMKFLEERDALGWSDLAAAFGAAFAAAGPTTQIVYVGDGAPTLGDADPGAFARKLPALWREKGGRGSVHAVVPGTTSEPLVLRALSLLGQGTMRSIDGAADPTQSAAALIAEITGPRVSDVKVEFEGLAVAAVHPETLPNLPAGRQQIVVGRFDAKGRTRGRVKVSGTITGGSGSDGKPISWSADVNLDDRGEKQSFVPRLWARHHLDHLLALGDASSTKERVIALSEEFQIATPYTSFLVLESEADRERFKVEKRTRMRDGEEFFAKGREDADFELLREQMKKAGLWHRGLRDDVLARLKTMGREATEALRPARPWGELGGLASTATAYGFDTGGGSGGKPGAAKRLSWGRRGDMDELSHDVSRNVERLGYVGDPAEAGEEAKEAEGEDLGDAAPSSEDDAYSDEQLDMPAEKPAPAASPVLEPAAASKRPASGFLRARSKLARLEEAAPIGGNGASGTYEAADRKVRGDDSPAGEIDSLFPSIAGPPAELRAPTWPEDFAALVRSLDRRPAIAAQAGVLRITTTGESVDLRGRTHFSGRGEHLLGKDDWTVVVLHRAGESFETQWLRGGERGAWRADWLLGRVRPRAAGDERAWPAPYPWAFGEELFAWRGWVAALRDLGDGKVELRFTQPGNPEYAVLLTIDRARALLLESRTIQHDEVTWTTRYSGFVERLGVAWPTTIEQVDAKGRVASTQRLEFEALDAAAAAARFDALLAPRGRCIELGAPPKDLESAKQAVADGKARLEDHLLLLRAALARGEPEPAQAPLAAIRKLVEGKPGLERIELAVLMRSRRHEELRQRLLADAAALAATPRDAEFSIVQDLLGLSSALDAGAERLELLRALDPVARRQAEIPEAPYVLDEQRIAALAAASRAEELFAAQEELAHDWPEQANAHVAFAHALAARGEFDRALGALDAAEKEHGPWEPYELDQLFTTRITLLWNCYRLEDLVAAVEARLREPRELANSWQLDQYLTAVVMLDRERAWWSTIESWLGAARDDVDAGRKLTDGARARVEAAIRQAIGQGWSCWWWQRRFDPAEARFLADVARALLKSEREHPYASQILTHDAFRQTPAARALLDELHAQVERGVESLPAAELARWIQLLRSAQYMTDDGEPRWQKLLDRVLARFVAATGEDERAQLEGVLLQHGRREIALAARLDQVAKAKNDDARGMRALEFLDWLFQGSPSPWTAELEAECLRLLPLVRASDLLRLGGRETLDSASHAALADADLRAKIVAWHDFVDWSVGERTAAAVAALPDVNSMPRRKLAVAREEQAKLARTAVLELLARRIAEPPAAADPQPVDWWKLDRAWLSTLLQRDLEATRAEMLALLKAAIDATAGRDPKAIELEERVLAARSATTLLLLLTKEAKTPEPLAAHERELLAGTDPAQAAKSELLDWRELEYVRLVALDRGDALEARLAEWFGGGDEFARLEYGRILAWIRAERGKLEEAVRVMEQVAKVDELEHADWLALSDWRTALGRKEDAANAKLAAWGALAEQELSGLVNAAANRVRDRGDGVPAELAPETADQLVALMRKAQWPLNYLWQLNHLYARTKDFRLLQCLPEAVIGHSAQGVYGFLGQLWGIEGLVDEEATVDRLVAHLDVVAERAKSDVDRRALNFLRFLAQWKAAAQKNGGGPHAQAALAAMKAAFERPLAEGEALHLAAFLAQMGAIAEPTLRTEQLRQLAEIVRRAEPGGEERLALAAAHAQVLWQAERKEESIRALGGELVARRSKQGGRLPDSANNFLAQHGGRLQAVGDHLGFEKLLQEEIAAAGNRTRVAWLETQLFQNHEAALRAGSRTSLGKGRELYAGAQQLLLGKLRARANESEASGQVHQLVALWSAARDVKISGVGDDVERFAFDELPAVLATYQYRSGQDMVGAVAQALHDAAGAYAAVGFLVGRAENEPRWLARVNQSFWDQHGWTLAQWRRESKKLDSQLERRLLALVVKELRAEMRFGRGRARALYDQQWDQFWREKRRDFAEAAKAELAVDASDEQVLLRVALYLFHGLSQHDDAIALLAERHRAGRLSLDAQTALARLLLDRKRFGEALPVVTGLIERRPDVLELRVMLMTGLHGVKQRAELEAARAAAEACFRERKQWNEETTATLARACYDTDLFEKAVAHYAEAIELHVKSAPNRGVGDGILPQYYGFQAQALAGLGRTDEAVDAAAGAVIAWGRRDDQRAQALGALEAVLQRAEDLDAYVGRLDAEVAKSGLENPIVRKALGKTWHRRGEWAKAAAQLKAALDVQPNDLEARQLLIEVYDRMKKPELAVAQLFENLESTGHDVALMRELGRRLAKLGATARAERVNTNLAEMLPNESESHQALAEIRDEQRRFADAAEQWRQVIRVRSKEPTGYLGLAKALLAAGEKSAAREPLEHLLSQEWESRFGDVKVEARDLLRRAGGS
jgi:predicted Zn-dependent protease